MDFKKSHLYGLRSLSDIECVLGCELFNYSRSENLWRQYHIELVDGVKIIEGPNNKLKQIQRTILSLLVDLEYPEYLFSVRGRNFIDGTALHIKTANHIIKMDIHKFFLSTGREKVYRFWKEGMKTSSTVANILTNLTTVDLRYCTIPEVMEYLKGNRLCLSHLGFGLPTSVALSFLCNLDMFSELERFASNSDMSLSVFVDDIVLSGKKNVTRKDFDFVRSIIMGHGYKINKKSKYQNGDKPILVTGLFLGRNSLNVPNNKHKDCMELAKRVAVSPECNKDFICYQGIKSYLSSVKKAGRR